MWISEPDEWQGLTPDMAQRYLDSKGWCNMPDPEIRLLKPQYVKVSFKMGLSAAVERIACIEGRTVQALLREINPRMRKGMPSAAAIAAHEAQGNHWLAKSAQNGGVLRVVILFLSDAAVKVQALDTTQQLERVDVPSSWCFWPCDEYGSKVRWPVDAEGNML